MTVMKRVLSCTLALVLILSLFAGCAKDAGNQTASTKALQTTNSNDKETQASKDEGPEYLSKEGFPIVTQPITLKFMVARKEVQPDFTEIAFFKELEKLTGIKIEWDQVPFANIDEKRNLALASNDLPDAFYRCNIPENDLVKYGTAGMLIELNGLIDKYGTNFKKIMETMPEVKKGLPAYNGKIYGMPSIFDCESVIFNNKMYMNKKWLDDLGLKMPSTTDELYTVLKAFREKDPNGNKIADEIPITSYNLVYLLNMLQGAWGLMNRGPSQAKNQDSFSPVDMDESTGKLRFIPTDPKFKEVLQFVNKLYKEKLVDQEIFTMNLTQLLAEGDQHLVGAFGFVNSQVIGTKYESEYEGLPAALKGPYGDQLWSPKRARLGYKGAFAITNVCKYPEAAYRMIDYFYSDEGTKMFYLGIEGVTYEKATDGSYKFKDDFIKNIPEGSSFDQVVSKYVPYAGGNNPTIVKTEFFKGGETQPIPLQAARNMAPYGPKEVWPTFSFTLEELDSMTALENDIMNYVKQMIPQFIQGKASFDEWDSYVAQFEKMKLDEYLKIYTAAYDRYKNN